MEVLINFLQQIGFTVGVVVLFGLLIALCRRAFCRIAGESGPKILLATGIIGTPIHELSHALMCVIFGHQIEEMKLYDPDPDDGTLGYVNHSYNPSNLYQRIGSFFIGVAPIICGSGVLLLLMFLLVPDIFYAVKTEWEYTLLFPTGATGIFAITDYVTTFTTILSYIFDFSYVGDVSWWIFIILSLSIASHMELSTADIKNGFVGFLYLAAVLLVLDCIFFWMSPEGLNTITANMATFSVSIASFLAISAVYSIAMVLIAVLLKGIIRIFKR